MAPFSALDWVLLGRYVADTCSADERQQVQRWLADPVEGRRVRAALQAIDRVAAQARRTVSPEDTAAQAIRLRVRMASANAGAHPRSRLIPFPYRQIAAAILLVSAGSLGYTLLDRLGSPTVTASPTVHTISTARGQRMSLRLADSTVVALAPASTLRFATTYGQRDRTVDLEGEAAFTVVHDENRPFTVRTARLVARDLGTRFIVRGYAGDSIEQVVVAEGEVDVAAHAASARPVLLAQGERADVTTDNRVAIAREVSLDSFFGWTEGRLLFRRTPLAEVVKDLERWYDVEIRLSSAELGKRGVNGSFGEREPVWQVLQAIAVALHLDVVEGHPGQYTLRAL